MLMPSPAFPRVCGPILAGLLGLGASGCLTSPQPPVSPAPPPQPAPATPANAAPTPPSPPQPPSVAPSPASVPGRLKIALVSSWLWVDGQYVSPLAQVDYLALFARLRDRRGAADSVEANTFELEIDGAIEGRQLRDLLAFVDDAGYERVELVTGSGRYGLCTRRCSSGSEHEGSSSRRVAVLLRRDVITVWSGNDAQVPADAAVGSADPKLEKLFEVPRSGADGDLEARLSRLCSEPGRCSHVVLQFEDDVAQREFLRVLAVLDRAARGAVGGGAPPPVIRLGAFLPPGAGDEAKAFLMLGSRSGTLPPLVIRQVVRASYGVFRGCYERGLVTNPNLEGRVTVRFVIQVDGSVGDVTNGGSDLPNDEVVQCVLQGFVGLRFPAPRGGIVTVQYPIMLQPG
jgi:hypothetical protein